MENNKISLKKAKNFVRSRFLVPVLLVLGTLNLSGCFYSGTYYDPYYSGWYDVYGNYCSSGYPYPGCNFYANGSKIDMYSDPYYYGSVYFQYDYWSYTDSWGYWRSYWGYAWLSPTGILYDTWGRALNELGEATEVSADVIAQAAAAENQTVERAGKAFAQNYALNEDAGIRISKTLQDWAKLGKDRARTEQDVEDFSSRLFGLSAPKAKAALAKAVQSGSSASLNEITVDVAAHWGTTPETSKAILKKWYQHELNKLGVK